MADDRQTAHHCDTCGPVSGFCGLHRCEAQPARQTTRSAAQVAEDLTPDLAPNTAFSMGANLRHEAAAMLREQADEIKRLRRVMAEAHGLLDLHMGDTDPQDPDHPLLRAAQLLAEALP